MIKIYSWFVLAIVLLIVTNVLGRFFLDFRFDFAVDVAPQLYGALIILGASYSLVSLVVLVLRKINSISNTWLQSLTLALMHQHIDR